MSDRAPEQDAESTLRRSGHLGHAFDPDVSREYAQKFLDAQTREYVSSVDEDDNVKALIDHLEANYDIVWKNLGRMENNYGLVNGSQGSKMGALVEIITNAFDAVLVRRYRERHGEDYDHSHAITTYEEAADLLFTKEEREYGPGGSDTEDTWVELYLDGGGRPGDAHGANFVVLDRGEGKLPEQFEDTFLDVLKPGQTKRGWPFLQGQFGMGGSAVLSYCGKGYKFIASASVDRPGVWTWSIIRRNRDQRTYEYMTVDGIPPTFEGEFADREIGSVVKMYDYEDSFPQMPGIGAYRLGRALYDIPMVMRLDDRRGYSSDVQDRRWHGHKYTLEETAANRGFIEEQFTITHDFGGAELDDGWVNLGEIDIEVFVFKSDEQLERMTIEDEFGLDPNTPKSELTKKQRKKLQNVTSRQKHSYRGNVKEHRKRAVSLVVNGQVHGDFGRRTLTGNTVGLDNVGKDILAYIDFSDQNGATLTDTFKSNRSYIDIDKPLGKKVRDEVFDMLRGNETLQQYEDERRRSRRKREHNERDIQTIESILEENPHLTQFFGSFGSVFPSITGTGEESMPVGDGKKEKRKKSPRSTGDPEDWIDLKYIPSTLDLLEKVKHTGEPVEWDDGEHGDEIFVKEIPVDSSGWIKFKLDAVNDYFTRQREHGELNIVPNEMVVDRELVSGILGIRIEPFENASPGDSNTVTVEITRPNSDPLSDQFKVEFVESRDQSTEKKPNHEKESGKESELLKTIGKPKIEYIGREDWGDEFNEDIIVHIEGRDPRDFVYRINIDAGPIASFRDRKNLNDAGVEIINDQWAAIVFYMSLGSYMKWAMAIDQKLREHDMPTILDDEILPDTPEQQSEDPLMPNEDDVEQVVAELDVRTVHQIDAKQMAAASVTGSVQTLLDWRYTDDDLDWLTEA